MANAPNDLEAQINELLKHVTPPADVLDAIGQMVKHAQDAAVTLLNSDVFKDLEAQAAKFRAWSLEQQMAMPKLPKETLDLLAGIASYEPPEPYVTALPPKSALPATYYVDKPVDAPTAATPEVKVAGFQPAKRDEPK